MPSPDLILLAFVGVCFLAALGGALFPPGAWYETIRKPSWQPPNWLFGPVWSILFLMIAVSGWLVWHASDGETLRVAMAVYGAQLILNFLWSAVFFGMKRMGLALFEMVFLWLSIVVNIVVFYPLDETAALLLVPYLAWVSFAFFLNATLLRLNRA